MAWIERERKRRSDVAHCLFITTHVVAECGKGETLMAAVEVGSECEMHRSCELRRLSLKKRARKMFEADSSGCHSTYLFLFY